MQNARRTKELKTILILSNEPETRATLVQILNTDYCMFEADTPACAVDMLRKNTDISAIVLSMSPSDGLDKDFLHELAGEEDLRDIPLVAIAACDDVAAQDRALAAGAADLITTPFNAPLVLKRIGNIVASHDAARNATQMEAAEREPFPMDTDDITGLLNKSAFIQRTKLLLHKNPGSKYILMRWDIDNYKIYNDTYGSIVGDDFLRSIGRYYIEHQNAIPGLMLVSRYEADHFICLMEAATFDSEQNTQMLKQLLSSLKKRAFEYILRVGVYFIEDPTLDVSLMCDRALLALKSVKHSYNKTCAWYDDSMRKELILEQRIEACMERSLKNGEFQVYFQPQYHCSTKELMGAEALVRWVHPNGVIVPPNDFIPIFERNGFVYELDKYVWEQVCILLRRWIDSNRTPMPLSVNVSRYDLMNETFYSSLTGLVEKYRIPVKLLRLEITESAFATNPEHLTAIVATLHQYGFTIEIDDFGSGYSSLNTLKDVPADILKLDMRFLQGADNLHRSGNIIESIIRMSNWLNMEVIAEGVETKQQSDFLNSIGCSVMQGYLYSKPISTPAFESLFESSLLAPVPAAIVAVNGMNADAFWNPESIDSLIFSSYVGGACVMEYKLDQLSLIRMNESFRDTLRTQYSIESMLGRDLLSLQTDETTKEYLNQIRQCTKTGATTMGVFKMFFSHDPVPHTEYLRYTLHTIAKIGDSFIMYALCENITDQTLAEQRAHEGAEQLKLLNDISRDLLSEADSTKAITGVLHKLIDHFAGDRAYICELSRDNQTLSATYDALASGTSVFPPIFQGAILSTISQWMESSQRRSHISLSLNELDESQVAERRMLESYGIKSLIASSLLCEGKLIGIMVVDNPSRNLEHVDRLSALSDYMVAMLTRRDLAAKIAHDNANTMNMMSDMPVGFVRMKIDPDGSIIPLFMNKAFCQLCGMTSEETLSLYNGDAFSGLFPDDRSAAENAIDRLIKNGGTETLRLQFIQKDGNYFLAQVCYRVTDDSYDNRYLNGYYIRLTSDPDTERYQRGMLDNLPVSVIAYEWTEASNHIYVNRSACQLFGLTWSDYQKRSTTHQPVDFIPEQLISMANISVWLASTDYFEPDPFPAKRKDGSSFWIKAAIRRITRDNLNPLIYIILTVPADDTALVKSAGADQTLQKASELLTHLPGGISCHRYMDGKPTLEYANSGLLKMSGYTEDSFNRLGMPIGYDAVHPEDIYQLARAEKNTITTGCPMSVEYRRLNKDNRYMWIDFKGFFTMESPGNGRLYGSYTDITEHKEMQARSLADQQRLNSLIDAIPGGVATYEMRPAGVYLLTVSEGMTALTGLTPEEYAYQINVDGKTGIYPPDEPMVNAAIERCVTENINADLNYRYVQKNGSLIWLNLRASRAGESNGYPLLLMVYHNLSDTMMLYQTILDETESILIVGDLHTEELLYANKAAERLAGRTFREADDSSFRHYLDSEMDPFIGHMPHEDESAAPWEFMLNGRHYLAHMTPINWNRRDAFVAFISDRTEQISFSTKLKTILNNIPCGVTTFVVDDDQINRTFISDGALQILGYDTDETAHVNIDDFMTRVHPDDHALVQREIKVAIDELRVFNVDMRICPSNGELRWVNLTANPVLLEDGRLYYFGIYTNVTERRAAQEKLREEHNRQAAQYQNELQFLSATQSDDLLTKLRIDLYTNTVKDFWVSDALDVSYEDYTFSQVLEHLCATIPNQQQRELVASTLSTCKLIEEYAKDHKEFRVEYQRKGADGRVLWMSTTVKTHVDSDTGHIEAFAYTYDIDEKQTLATLMDRLLTLQIETVGLINVATGRLHYYRPSGTDQQLDSHFESEYMLVLQQYIQAHIDAELQSEARQAFGFSTVLKHLPTSDSTYTFSYWTHFGHKRLRKQWIFTWLDDSLSTIVIARTDVTELFLQQEEHHAALLMIQEETEKARMDTATGLLNSTATKDDIGHLLSKADSGRCAMLLIDLDDLKTINDVYGHPQGDKALLTLAMTLKKHFRSTDVIGRMGGDEFMVFLSDIGNSDIRRIIQRVQSDLHSVYLGSNGACIVHCSVGCTLGEAAKSDFETMYKQADIALYHVKRSGKNSIAFYTPSMETAAYEFQARNELTLKATDLLNVSELQALLAAVSTLYSLIIYVNLTRNSYRILEYVDFKTQVCLASGCFDDLIVQGCSTFKPEDRASFAAKYARENLLAAHQRGERSVSHVGSQLGYDGIYRRIQTDVVFFTDNATGDLCELTMSRAIDMECQ